MGNIVLPPISDNLIAKNLQSRNAFQAAAMISGFYRSPLFFLINGINPKGSKQVNTIKYESATIGNLSQSEPIASSSIVAGNLVINFVDTSYDKMRTGWMVLDNNRVKGQIIDKQPGQITISAQGTAFTASHFTAGMFVNEGWNVSAIDKNRGTESRDVVPDPLFDVSGVTRTSYSISNYEMIDTMVKGKDGKSWWSTKQEFNVADFVDQLERKMIHSELIYGSATNGMLNHTGGLIWAIKNRQGLYIPSPTLFSLAQLRAMVYQLKVQNGGKPLDLVAVMGANALQNLQIELTNNFIKYSGENNLFGGATVKGESAFYYSILGVPVRLVHGPFLDNKKGLFSAPCALDGNRSTKGNNTVFLIDIHDIPSYGGGTQPAIEMFHYGQEFMYGMQLGMGGNMTIGGSMPTDPNSASPQIVQTDLSETSFHLSTQNGISIKTAIGMAMFEPQS